MVRTLENTVAHTLEIAKRLPGRNETVSPSDENTLLNNYQLLAFAGEGMHGKVFKAWDPVYNEIVAIKIDAPNEYGILMRAHRKQENSDIPRKERGKRTHAPHLAPRWEEFDENGVAFHVMPYYETFLNDVYIKEGERLHLGKGIRRAQVESHAHGLVEALYELHHSWKIAHRDLKLENIALVDDGKFGNIVVTDHGLSSQLDTLTKDNRANIGLPLLRPPENFMGWEAPGEKYDVWMLGGLLYRMYTGNYPLENLIEQAGNDEDKMKELLRPLYHEGLFGVRGDRMIARSLGSIRSKIPVYDYLVKNMLKMRSDERPEDGMAVKKWWEGAREEGVSTRRQFIAAGVSTAAAATLIVNSQLSRPKEQEEDPLAWKETSIFQQHYKDELRRAVDMAAMRNKLAIKQGRYLDHHIEDIFTPKQIDRHHYRKGSTPQEEYENMRNDVVANAIHSIYMMHYKKTDYLSRDDKQHLLAIVFGDEFIEKVEGLGCKTIEDQLMKEYQHSIDHPINFMGRVLNHMDRPNIENHFATEKRRLGDNQFRRDMFEVGYSKAAELLDPQIKFTNSTLLEGDDLTIYQNLWEGLQYYRTSRLDAARMGWDELRSGK